MKKTSKVIIGLFLLTQSSILAASNQNNKIAVPSTVKCLKIQMEKKISLEKAYQTCSVKK